MFSEGSLFAEPVAGGVADVTPDEFKDHRIYRYGIGMFVALQKNSIINERERKKNRFEYLEL